MNYSKAVILLLLFSSCCVLWAQDARQAVQQAVNAELAADQTDHSCWIFHEIDRKPGLTIVQWVAQTHQGDVNRVIEKNGTQIPESQQRKAVQSFIHDSSAQAKQRRSDQHDDQQAEAMLKLLPKAFVWTVASHSGQTTTYHFQPDPKFQPPTREARVFSAMEGDMTVDNSQHRIQQLKGRMIRDVNFGYGLFGKLYKGGSFEVQRRQTGNRVWQITETHVHIQGRALLFKTISEQEDDTKTNFTQQPENITPEQAATAVMGKK